jgi:hypothetical protein
MWALAAELAMQHGVFRTAQVLRLDYTELKQRARVAAPAGKPASTLPAFVELITPAAAQGCECVIKVEGPRRRMRVEWKAHSAGPGWSEPNTVGARRLIQITPQIRILVAVEPIDARKYPPAIDMRSCSWPTGRIGYFRAWMAHNALLLRSEHGESNLSGRRK